MTTSDYLNTAALQLPADFLEAVADHGETALAAWLRANAPKNVHELFDSLMSVKVEAEAARAGNPQRRTDSSLLEYVSSVARCVTELGGTWHGATGPILRRVNAEAAEASPELRAVTIP